MGLKALVVTGYGFNSDAELAEAFRLAGADARRVHLADLVERPAMLADFDFVGIPGGFSFGDHLGSGQVVANILRDRIWAELGRFASDGGLVIGICNGFQVLVKTGLLPYPATGERAVTLAHNDRGEFIDEWVPIEFGTGSKCVWTAGLEPIMLPVRHGEGRFVARDGAALERLEREGLVAARYASANPNGSANGIAAVCDPSGRVFGIMPHPECFLVESNHPLRRRGVGGGTGVGLFRNAVAWKERA